ncbi:MAG: AAA family ATPase [Actinomycetota bacterium]|nr:AAA family ATPase [Actinomycetota bacterium]
MDALVEREAEAAALHAIVHGALTGRGAAAMVLGPAGIGKSALLQMIPEPALRARGGELEQDFPYGVMRQLFEGRLRRLNADARAAVLGGPARPIAGLLLEGERASDQASSSDGFALEHAFFWLVAHLAELAPLVVVVDDLHWADVASLRALLYLARRLADLPVSVVLASRPVTDTRAVVVQRLIAEAAILLEPAPLSSIGVGSLVHRSLAEADDSFCDACHAASGGNPFLLSELIGAVRASGIEPVGINAGRVRSIGAQSVMRSVVLRLGGLSPDASAIARTLAVAGEHLWTELVASLAEVSSRLASSAIDELRDAHLVEFDEPLRFVHSIVRDAVYNDVPRGERSRIHRAAAESLSAAGASPDAVASHLLLTTPGTDAWTFEQLVAAASTPAASAVPETTAAYLERALRESVSGVDRGFYLLALGAARFQIVGGDAIGPLRQVLELAADKGVRADATRALASAYMTQLRFDESWELIEASIVEFADEPDIAPDLEIYSAQLVYSDITAEKLQILLDRIGFWRPDRNGGSIRDRSMLALQAWVASTHAAPAEVIAPLALAALSTESLVSDDLYYVSIDIAVWSLVTAGCYDEALAQVTTAIDSCIEAGRLLRAATLLPIRAEIRRRIGRLADGRDDARFAVELIPATQVFAPQAAAAYVLALVEGGDARTARKMLADSGFGDEIPLGGVGDALWFARGRLRIAEGDLGGGVADLLTYGAICHRLQRRNPGHFPWRSTAVEPLVQLGRGAEALEIAGQEVALAEATGVREQRGRALLGLGTALGADGIGELTHAVALLDSSRFQTDAALANLTLGKVLRRAGKRERARELLRAAADTASRIGARPIAAEARAELLASGARPRRSAATGVRALTPSESRVAALAAQGLTNREIAQALFVTPKTIETHLAAAYRKLGIAGKGELTAVLAAG